MKVSVFYANTRSIVNKIAKLQMKIASSVFDIIVLTETDLDSPIKDAEILGREYCVYRLKRPPARRSFWRWNLNRHETLPQCFPKRRSRL